MNEPENATKEDIRELTRLMYELNSREESFFADSLLQAFKGLALLHFLTIVIVCILVVVQNELINPNNLLQWLVVIFGIIITVAFLICASLCLIAALSIEEYRNRIGSIILFGVVIAWVVFVITT